MERPNDNATDASSIKPVSSLRSHFETMHKNIPSQPAQVPPRPSALPPHMEAERGRSSLDLQRNAPLWNPSESSDTNQGSNIQGINQPIPRRLEPESGLRQRPVSVGTWSPPGATPSVTVQSPFSPPNSLPSPVPKLVSQAQPSGKVSNPFSPSPTFDLSPSESSRSQWMAKTPGSAKPDAFEKPALSPAVGAKKPPPPVNRAAKPLAPSTPVLGLGLMPDRSTEKVSPFSTPPSSDESPERSSRPKMQTHDSAGTRNAFTLNTTFPPPPTRNGIEARKEAARISGGSATPSIRSASASRPEVRVQTEQPPTLPARREAESPAKTHVHSIKPAERKISSSGPSPPRPSETSKISSNATGFLPPPKRIGNSGVVRESTLPVQKIESPRRPGLARSLTDNSLNLSHTQAPQVEVPDLEKAETADATSNSAATEFPDMSQVNRRPPQSKAGARQILTQLDSRLLDVCGKHVCTSGYVTKAWELTNGKVVSEVPSPERESKATSLVFKPAISIDQEGQRVWIGNNQGDIHEIDLKMSAIAVTRTAAHGRREIVKMHRYQNSIWSIDEDGKLHVWKADDQGVPNLNIQPDVHRICKGHTFSLLVKTYLWVAAGRDIRVYNPSGGDSHFYVTTQALSQPNVGEITSGALINSQQDKVFFGHTDGKISIYSTKDFACLGVVGASMYRVTSLAGAGFFLWAGFNSGRICVYDTQTRPWRIKKDWAAHSHPVSNLVVHRSSVWTFGHLQVASLGLDQAIRLWDGMLEDDWIDFDMRAHDIDFCEFHEIKATLMTWNAGASTPGTFRHEDKESNAFRDIIQAHDPPDLLVFGFQELVDLEDKKLTAKSLFKGSKKKDGYEQDHMSSQYRAWRDYLIQNIDDLMPSNLSYYLLQTANMVGLFSCIFVKSTLRDQISSVSIGELKRGFGGLHGNKGAIAIRFALFDSTLCFTNCHLAAGQTQTVDRNKDITAVLETPLLPTEDDPQTRMDTFIDGGDGSMVMDHEICIVNGDMNYRIDTMSRDAVIRAVKAGNLTKLLERDQLLVSRRRNPTFRLRTFNEQQIAFAPTYKYDVGTDRYDTSDKGRSPAWCDRVLYRGLGRIKQIDYRRHEVRVSDHRPVSATFLLRVKSIDPDKRAKIWGECEKRLLDVRRSIARDAKLDYLVSILGVEIDEARRLIDKP